jgi:uncharacterized protein YbaA (DUF1428 family)
MAHVDGFLLAVPQANRDACRSMAESIRASTRLKMEGKGSFDMKRMIFGGFEVLVDA